MLQKREQSRCLLWPRGLESGERIVTQGGPEPGPSPVPASCLLSRMGPDPGGGCLSQRTTSRVPFPQQYTVLGLS